VTGKLERDLTADETRSAKRWVRDYGSFATTCAIGGVLEDGMGPNMRIIRGRLKRQQQERDEQHAQAGERATA
jgi:hypothetical protein